MECNKQPPITGEKGEAALQRVRLIPFEVTFTDDKEKLAANPEKYKPKDDSLKTPGFKEDTIAALSLSTLSPMAVTLLTFRKKPKRWAQSISPRTTTSRSGFSTSTSRPSRQHQ